MPLLHRQPFKTLYIIYFAAKALFVDIPFWTLTSLPRSSRPRPTWSIGRCLRIRFLRAVIGFPLKLGLTAKRDLSEEVPNSTLRDAEFVWVEGVDASALRGAVREFAERARVEPARIPGYWQFKKGAVAGWTPEVRDGETVVYHLHGGAMYMGSAHPSEITASILWGILHHSTTVNRTFALDYRLSASAPFPVENPFPAALLDCIAGYQYLVGLGFRPENIVVAGDSAGGNLALALVRYLTQNGTSSLACPGRLLVFSPWGDLSSSRGGPTSSLATNTLSDILPPWSFEEGGFISHGAKSYIGTALDRSEAKTNIYISPSSPHLHKTKGMFEDFPRTYILAGGAEMILDDSKVIAERIEADSGRDGWVTLDVQRDAVHDFCALEWFEPERSEALARVSRWIDMD